MKKDLTFPKILTGLCLLAGMLTLQGQDGEPLFPEYPADEKKHSPIPLQEDLLTGIAGDDLQLLSPGGSVLFRHINERTSYIFLDEKRDLACPDMDESLSSALFLSEHEIVLGSTNGRLSIWQIGSRCFSTMNRAAHEGAVQDIYHVRNRNVLVSSGKDKKIRIWDLSGKLRQTIEVPRHLAQPEQVAVSDDLSQIAVTAASGQVFWWHKKKRKYKWQKPIDLPSGLQATFLDFAPGSHDLLVADDSRIRHYYFGKLKSSGPDLGSRISSAQLSENGRHIAVASEEGLEGMLFFVNAEIKLSPMTFFIEHQGQVSYVAFSSDGRYFFTVGEDGTFKRWDLSGKKVKLVNIEEQMPF